MGKLFKITALFAFLSSAVSNAASFMPPNDLHLQDPIVSRYTDITEKEFNALIDKVVDKYKSIVGYHGGNLVVEKNWKDGTVNAYADQEGKTWTVAMFGGLARRPEVTADGFQLVVCHELGHHLGGFPFYSSTPWAANEGQSDYFATQACAKLLWGQDYDNNAKSRDKVPTYVKERCDKVYASNAERDLCYRSALAGQSLANLLAALGGSGTPKFETPSTREVRTTQERHPDAQCRLDTYLAGALCEVAFDPNVIPGKGNAAGRNSEDAEKIAARYSCTSKGGSAVGIRPRCWFKNRF